MTDNSILFIGLDTHKEFFEIAYIEDQRGATPVHFGRISSAKASIQKFACQINLSTQKQLCTSYTQQDHVDTGYIVY